MSLKKIASMVATALSMNPKLRAKKEKTPAVLSDWQQKIRDGLKKKAEDKRVRRQWRNLRNGWGYHYVEYSEKWPEDLDRVKEETT